MLPRSSLADATPPVKELDNDRNLLLRSGRQDSNYSRNSHRSARRREPPKWIPKRLGWPPISIFLRNKKVSTPSDINRIEHLALMQYISPSEERDVPLVRPHITRDVLPKLREAFCLFSGTLVKLERGVNSHVLRDVARFMAFHFDSRGLRQAGSLAFDVLICIKRSPSRVTRC